MVRRDDTLFMRDVSAYSCERQQTKSTCCAQPLEFAMNIELDEVVVLDVSDDSLELAASGAQGGALMSGATCRNMYC